MLTGVDRTDAQFVMGLDGGMGYMFQPYQSPASVRFLQERSNINAQNAMTNRGFNLGQSGNPNAYWNRRREAALTERSNVSTRQGLEGRVSRSYDPRPNPRPRPPDRLTSTPRPTAPAPETRPAPSLGTFFNNYEELVWPADAPTEGELAPLRQATDQAALVAAREYQKRGYASISTVATARESLLDYGRPALQYVRDRSTAQVADTFHSFLLALYGSLEKAVNPINSQQ